MEQIGLQIEKPLTTFGLAIESIFESENGSLICSDGISILVIDNTSGEIWRSEQISWDGFKDLSLDRDIISGFAYDPTDSTNDGKYFRLT